MSSLAAARADGFYYPPEYEAKHGSLNKFHNSHPLGDRAKKIKEGILVIRFEMPFKVICLSCENYVAKGVRFNAEKKTVGHFHSTKILEFSMKCYHCDNIFKIRTDPENCDYVVTEGLRRKVETFDPKDAETLEFLDDEDRERLKTDPMFKLEKTMHDKRKAEEQKTDLEMLMDISDDRADTFTVNRSLRDRFRHQKAVIKERILEESKSVYPLPMLPPTPAETKEAKSVKKDISKFRTEASRKRKIARIISSSIFDKTPNNKPSRSSVPHRRHSSKHPRSIKRRASE